MEISDIQPQGAPSPEGQGHEDRGAKVKYVLIFATALATVVVVFQVALAAWLGSLRVDREQTNADRPELLDNEDGLYPGPRLQETASGDMLRMARRQARELDAYRWVVPGKLAKIPVGRALDLVASEGLDRPDPGPEAADGSPEIDPTPESAP